MQRDFSTAANLIYLLLCPGLSSTIHIIEFPWSKGLSKINKENESPKAQGAETGFFAQITFLSLGCAVLSPASMGNFSILLIVCQGCLPPTGSILLPSQVENTMMYIFPWQF